MSLKRCILLLMLLGTIVHCDGRAQVQVQSGPVLLSITTAVPGEEPAAVSNSTTRVRFRRQAVITKLTILTSCPNQHFTLRALAIGVTGGIAAPEVQLVNGMPATDLVIDIPSSGANWKQCSVRYTTSATFSQGNSVELGGDDIHTVTYTLVAQ